MTAPKVHEHPAAGSVEQYLSILRSRGNVELYFEGRALAVIQAVAEDLYLKPGEKVSRIRNVLAGVQQIREEIAASSVGLNYSRVDDDPQVVRPHSPRMPMHVGVREVDGGELLAIAPAADGGVVWAMAPAGAVVDPVARAAVVEAVEAVAADPPRETVHLLEAGADGADDDRMECGARVVDVDGWVESLDRVTCRVCIAAVNPADWHECGDPVRCDRPGGHQTPEPGLPHLPIGGC
jgi:hypothetical protein